MVFYKVAWDFFKLASIMLTQTLLSFVAYCVALDMACPKHNPRKGEINFKVEQPRTKV
jgi:hypothetical protein